MPKYARSRDGNELDIVNSLTRAGATVQRTYGMEGEPDLIVGYGGVTYLLEVKNPKASRSRSKAHDGRTLLKDEVDSGGEFEGMDPRLNRRQARWHRNWNGSKPVIVETAHDALTAIEAPCYCSSCAAHMSCSHCTCCWPSKACCWCGEPVPFPFEGMPL